MNKTIISKAIYVSTFALATMVATPAHAATYPGTIKNETASTSTFAVGDSTEPVKKKVAFQETGPLRSTKGFLTTAVGDPIKVSLPRLTPGQTVTSTIKGPDGAPVKLPPIVVAKNGSVNLKAIAFKKPGKYTVTYTLPDKTTRTVTVTVK